MIKFILKGGFLFVGKISTKWNNRFYHRRHCDFGKIILILSCFCSNYNMGDTHTHIHTFLALVNMTIFKCGKGSTHIDYLSGTQDMDILFSKVSSYLRKNPIILQYILLCSSQHYNITFIHAYLILRQMIQSLDVNLRMFCCIRDAALGLNHRSEKVDSYSSEISKKN